MAAATPWTRGSQRCQVRNVASDVFVQDAWASGQTLTVHGWVYSLANGLVTDLDVEVSDMAGYEALLDPPR